MEQFAKDFQSKYTKIAIEEEVQTWFTEDDEGRPHEEDVKTYNISSIPGLENLTLNIHTSGEFEQLDQLIAAKPNLFKDYLGGTFEGVTEVVLTRVSRAPFLPRSRPSTINIETFFEGDPITIEIKANQNDATNIGFIASKLVGIRSIPRYSSAVAKISGIKSTEPQTIESTASKILRSVLFDIEYTYGHAFETTHLENLKHPQGIARTKRTPLPKDRIQLIYKNYIPELIEYFHVAERVDYLPFKYICYFHVVEYFMDKSAYSVVSRKVKQLLLSPDFHLRSSEYIANAVNIIKLETERNTTDKIKINRVLGEFIQPETLKKHLTEIGVIEHFNKDHTLACAKPLKLSGIKFDSEQSFIDSASKRIYAMRCSIVHSNPDFDESKAVPFLATPRNIEFLRAEIELIKEVSKTIICSSHN
jgi:hypothetical protein